MRRGRLKDSTMVQFSLPSHYDVYEEENGYCFNTDSGNTYYVTFIKYPTISEYLSVDIFMMNIDRADEQNHLNGDKNLVRNTILFFISSGSFSRCITMPSSQSATSWMAGKPAEIDCSTDGLMSLPMESFPNSMRHYLSKGQKRMHP